MTVVWRSPARAAAASLPGARLSRWGSDGGTGAAVPPNPLGPLDGVTVPDDSDRFGVDPDLCVTVN